MLVCVCVCVCLRLRGYNGRRRDNPRNQTLSSPRGSGHAGNTNGLSSFQARESRPCLCVYVFVCVCEATLVSSETIRESRICLRREVAGVCVRVCWYLRL